MRKNIMSTPLGTRDLLFEECEAQNEIKNRLMQVFLKRGYNEVVTPTLEYLDVFMLEQSSLPIEQLYKMTDKNGRLLAMRPDLTMPIARLVGTRLKNSDLPIRLCYTEKVFRVNASLNGRNDEVTQSGIELIGVSGKKADLEVIITAAEALKQCGTPDFKIEIGHAGFFKALTANLPADDDIREDIRVYIENKNYTALDNLLNKLGGGRAAEALKRLPRLFGDIKALDEAIELYGDLAPEPLKYLKEIYNALTELGLQGKINVDLGLVHRNNYYTGLLFRGYIEGSGITVLSGGRYDNLLKEFGRPLPATGFAIENDALAGIILSNGEIKPPKTADVLVLGERNYEMKAIIYANKLISEGIIAQNCVLETIDQAKNYAINHKIKRLDIINEKVQTIDLMEKV